jgi:DNA-directed RNA polymerase specialized sigma24 family protein
MQSPELVWFDRQFDSLGKPIRDDVRQAAKNKWPQLVAMGRRRLGDRDQELQEAFERSIERVSRYLDRKKAPPQDASALLVLRFRQEVQKLLSRQDRVISIGTSNDLEALVATDDWAREAERRLVLDELVRSLSKENRIVLRLRRADLEWSEIARILQKNVSAVQKNFWREVRRLYSEFNEIAKDEAE